MWLSTKQTGGGGGGGGGKNFSFVVSKSRYRDTQKTPSVTYETLIVFSLFGAVRRKQYTINIICM